MPTKLVALEGGQEISLERHQGWESLEVLNLEVYCLSFQILVQRPNRMRHLCVIVPALLEHCWQRACKALKLQMVLNMCRTL